MGRGTRLRRSPPGSALGSPMFGAAACNGAFAGGFGGGGLGGGIASPIGLSPTAAFADHQQVRTHFDNQFQLHLSKLLTNLQGLQCCVVLYTSTYIITHLHWQAQQQALLRAATLAAAASQPLHQASFGSSGYASSGPLPHMMPAAPHMRQRSHALDAFTAAASAATTAAASAAFAAGLAAEPAAGGARGRRQGSSDAESEQACAPFAHVESNVNRSSVPAIRPAGVGGGSLGAGKPGGLKGGSGGRRIDITVDATPLVNSTTGCQEIGSGRTPNKAPAS